MIRRLLTVASVLMLLLSIGVISLGARSYRVSDGFVWMDHGDGRPDHINQLAMGDGWLKYARQRCGGYRHRMWYIRNASSAALDPVRQPVSAPLLGCYALGTPSSSLRGFIVPVWMVVCVTALMPVAGVTRHFRTRGPRRQGHCRTCGYDLRATPDRCPECGTPITPNGGTPA